MILSIWWIVSKQQNAREDETCFGWYHFWMRHWDTYWKSYCVAGFAHIYYINLYHLMSIYIYTCLFIHLYIGWNSEMIFSIGEVVIGEVWTCLAGHCPRQFMAYLWQGVHCPLLCIVFSFCQIVLVCLFCLRVVIVSSSSVIHMISSYFSHRPIQQVHLWKNHFHEERHLQGDLSSILPGNAQPALPNHPREDVIHYP